MNDFFLVDRLIDELKKEITLYQELFGEKSSGIQATITENAWGRTINISDPDGNRVGIRDEAGFVHQFNA